MRTFAVIAVFAGAVAALAQTRERPSLDLENPTIRYSTEGLHDPAAELNRRLADGSMQLDFDKAFGYLPSVLTALAVPIESQMMVFSKTSLQSMLISPENPRAIYFNDAVTIGFVRGGPILEVAAQDPKQGIIFYTLDQSRQDRPVLTRANVCLSCHNTAATLDVPGVLARTVFPSVSGAVVSDLVGSEVDHRVQFDQRWGGWYVTGKHAPLHHLANAVVGSVHDVSGTASREPVNPPPLKEKFATSGFPTPYSDVAALTVFEHQMHLMNLMTRTGWEARLELPQVHDSVTELVDYLLFVGEAPLDSRIEGTSGFTEMFAQQGPFDRKGRSLRQLDLDRRLMRYPCSYMIYSSAFNSLPGSAKDETYHRMWKILSGQDRSPRYARLSAGDRRAVVEILRDTLPDLPEYFAPDQVSRHSAVPPENRPVPPESSQKTRYGTSRNPRNGAAILAVPRLNLLCSMLLSAHQHGQYSDPVSGRYWFFGGRYMRYAAPILVGLIAMLPPAAHLNAQSARPAFQDNYAEVNGVRLHYASVGRRPLVLFLHGYPSFWYQWKDQMAEMGRDHLAVGLDMRGYNLSSRPQGLEPYAMPHLVEDVRQFVEKVAGRNQKFVLVGHDWGANVAWVFAMYHPEMLEKLIIVNGAHPFISERELRENPAQRYASNYFFVFNKFLAPGEQPVDENDTKESASRRAHAGFVDAEVKSGRYTEQDRQMWIDAWSQPGSTTAGLSYYRANRRNPPFNDRHPASTIPTSWSAKEITKGAKSTTINLPTLVIWGMRDAAILSGHLSGIDKWVPNLSVKLYPDDDHWVMLAKATSVAQDIRRYIDDSKNFPKESVYRAGAR